MKSSRKTTSRGSRSRCEEAIRNPSPDWLSLEFLSDASRREVPDALFWKHLGVPAGGEVGESVMRSVATVRRWFVENARPWWRACLRPIRSITDKQVVLDTGVTLNSSRLSQGFGQVNARAVIVVGLSAGAEVDAEISRLWELERPDEAMFLNALSIAFVENLRSVIGRRFAERLAVIEHRLLPHYSPGYEGWDLGDQSELLRFFGDSSPVQAVSSGGLEPSKSTVAVFGLARGSSSAIEDERSFWDRCAAKTENRSPSVPMDARGKYAFPERALEKWSRAKVTLDTKADGRIRATFRFDGSTCTNMGLPLRIDYVIDLQRFPDRGYVVGGFECRTAPDDSGHRATCLYLSSREAFGESLRECPPLQGCSLDAALEWDPGANPSGCLCTFGSRQHKWRIVLHTVHYALCGNGGRGGLTRNPFDGAGSD